VLRDIEAGSVQATAQDPEEGGYFPRRYPHDSEIQWDMMTDLEVHNLVRAMHGPYPSAFSFRKGSKVEIEQSSLASETIKGVPGEIVDIQGDHVLVMAKNRALIINHIVIKGVDTIPAEYFKVGDILSNNRSQG
jgi:methionyl-tRNA formyltransferase